MSVEASFRQACLLHHRPDPAAISAALTERTSSHGENLLAVLRFMFRRVSHDVRVRSYSNGVKRQKIRLGVWMPRLRIFDIDDADGRPYFTMEIVEAGSLAQRLSDGTHSDAYCRLGWKLSGDTKQLRAK